MRRERKIHHHKSKTQELGWREKDIELPIFHQEKKNISKDICRGGIPVKQSHHLSVGVAVQDSVQWYKSILHSPYHCTDQPYRDSMQSFGSVQIIIHIVIQIGHVHSSVQSYEPNNGCTRPYKETYSIACLQRVFQGDFFWKVIWDPSITRSKLNIFTYPAP